MKKSKVYFRAKIISLGIGIVLTIAALIVVPVYAWLAGREISVYAPVNTATSLYIGAGNQEDIRYLSFEGIDATSEQRYKDFVFSVSGEFVRYYKIQLAFTTNNQFTFGLFRATTVEPENPQGTVNYITNDGSGRIIPYYIKDGGQINGVYKNKQQDAYLGIDSLNDEFYNDTYGSYQYVDDNAVPLYWQTSNAIEVGAGDAFPHYFILRLYFGDKDKNDRETDIICIAARVFSNPGTVNNNNNNGE